MAVAGPVSAIGDGEAPLAVSPDQSGSPGVVSTAQSDTETSPESDTEPRLVGRESSERVDGVVIALWSIAAGMTVMLVLFLWHTSPRRRLRLARRRSTQLYDGEAQRAGDATGTGSAGEAEVVDYAEAGASRQDSEAVAVVASGAGEDPEPSGAVPPSMDAAAKVPAGVPASQLEPSGAVLPSMDAAPTEARPADAGPTEARPADTTPAEAGSSDADEAGPEQAGRASGPAEPVLPAVDEEEPEVAEPELPPVWEDESGPAGDEEEPAEESPADESPEAGKTARERMSGFWMQLRRTLGLD